MKSQSLQKILSFAKCGIKKGEEDKPAASWADPKSQKSDAKFLQLSVLIIWYIC